MQASSGTSLSVDSPTAHQPPQHRRILLCAAVALVAYLLDQSSKWWAVASLDPADPVTLIDGVLQLRLTRNPGAAFSVGTGYTLALSLVAIGVILFCIRMASRLGSTGWALALGLLIGGALGNVTDRIFRDPGPLRGHVIDFLELPNWPVFNLADTAICLAAVLLVFLSARGISIDGSRAGVGDDHAAAPEPDVPRGDRPGDEPR
jgi:signal peptidase II